ncbi:hypothetical protein BC834DRAFT_873269 [Gloeopeniophorella convolvens]|nr:hypothetical protein BC834DRAFT_873269 [Gloeopeniophorella convolvens]
MEAMEAGNRARLNMASIFSCTLHISDGCHAIVLLRSILRPADAEIAPAICSTGNPVVFLETPTCPGSSLGRHDDIFSASDEFASDKSGVDIPSSGTSWGYSLANPSLLPSNQC